MGYVEHAPCPALARWVECFWTLHDELPRSERRVLPDGCADILVDLSGPEPRASVVGTMTRALLVPPAVRSELVAVRFRPGGAWPFFGAVARLDELTDRRVELGELWGTHARLLDALAGSGDPGARVRALEAELVRRLPSARPLDERVTVALDRIVAAPGAVSISTLAAELEVSRQHLAQRFRRSVGLGPKELCRVLRLRGVIGRMGAEPELGWAQAAADAGYADQAHLVGDCRRLTGLRPTELPNLQDARRRSRQTGRRR